jgi:hypothetical protein
MNSEYGELVNLDSLHYAKVLNDTADSYQADTNKYLAPAAEMKKEAKVDTATRYYDGKPMFSSSSEASTDVTLTVSGVPSKKAAELTGKPYDATRGIMIDTGDVSNAPYYAYPLRAAWATAATGIISFSKDSFHSVLRPRKPKRKSYGQHGRAYLYRSRNNHEFHMPDGSKSGTKGSGRYDRCGIYRRRSVVLAGADAGNAR